MKKRTLLVSFAAFLCAALSTPLFAAIIVPGADGSDGAFAPTASVEIDLSQAVTGTWDQAGNGKGVYDADKWAVVFKYSSVDIQNGAVVTFKNHPSGAPVVWLVQGDVNVGGPIRVWATADSPGPGGFGSTRGIGSNGGGGTYQSRYGNPRVMPLIGGSGGGYYGSGCGGGAILVAAAGAIRIQGAGSICANAVSHGGSGGGIRLVCDKIENFSEGNLLATGAYADTGRIRVEANQVIPELVPGNPLASLAVVGTTAQIWPESTAPRIKSVSFADIAIPSDPKAVLPPDVYIAGAATKTLVIQAENVPLDWHVRAHWGGQAGNLQDYEATRTGGDLAISTWEAQIPIVVGYSAIQVRASVD